MLASPLNPVNYLSIPKFLQEHNAYQLASLEQQDQLYDSLTELNRSLLTDREERHADVEELSFQVEGLREDLNRFFVGPRPARGAQRSELPTTRSLSCPEYGVLIADLSVGVQSDDGDGKTTSP